MPTRKPIQNELNALGSSLPLAAPQPFAVPAGYFENLPAAVLARVKAEGQSAAGELAALSPLLASLSKEMPYTVPPAYFNQPWQAITDDQPSALLESIGREMPYSVPDDYFEALPTQVLARCAKPKAKVVPLFGRTWARAAVAASVAVAVLFGGYRLLNREEPSAPVAVEKPAGNSGQLAQNGRVPQEIKQASTPELEAFIETVDLPTTGKTQPKDDNQQKESVADLLKDVPTAEVERFLSALPAGDDELFTTD